MQVLTPDVFFARGLRHQRARDIPHTPDNRERLQRFRVACVPTAACNSHPWPHLKKERRP